jgi:hypothetical protein
MAYLVDTSMLVRLAKKSDIQHGVALHAAIELNRGGEILHLTPKVLIEFRNLATRPIAQNGLELSAIDTAGLAAGFETEFPLVEDTPDIYPHGIRNGVPGSQWCPRKPSGVGTPRAVKGTCQNSELDHLTSTHSPSFISLVWD